MNKAYTYYLVPLVLLLIFNVGAAIYLKSNLVIEYDSYGNALVSYDEGFSPGVYNAMSYMGYACAIWLFLVVFVFRQKIRAQYGMQPKDCEDCLVSYCCQCCVLAQQDRHTKEFPLAQV